MAQQNIDFGAFPDDPSADAIRTAFQKVQTNFTELYSTVNQGDVASVNKTAGAGITVNSPTGNVVVSANIACVQVFSSTLGIGIGTNNGSYACVTQSSQILFVDLPGNISGVSNISISGNLTANNITANSNVTAGNFIGRLANGNSNVNIPAANGNITLSVSGNANVVVVTGTGANIAGTLQVSGVSNLGPVGNVVITGGSAGQYLQTNGSGGLSWQTVTAGAVSNISNGTSNVDIPASGGNVNTSVGAVANVLVVTTTGANITGTANVSGNANVGNLGAAQVLASANVTAPQLISNVATGTAPFVVTSTTQVANLNVASSGTAVSSTNAAALLQNTSTATTVYPTFTTSSANGNSQAVFNTGISANLGNNAITATQFVGTHVGNVVANVANGTIIGNNHTITGAATGNANVSTVTGNLGLRAIFSTYTDNSAAASATIANAAIHALAAPNLAAANATVTFTNAATFYIAGAPVANGTTITNPYALYIGSGGSFFAGNVSTTGTTRIQQALEKITISATAATGTINFDVLTQGVLYYTTNASANWTLNIRGNSTVSLNTVMNTGESLTIAFMVTNGATPYYQTAFQVDGASVTPKWQGGTAPSSGNASSIDTYTVTIIKTGSAAFTALAAQTRFA